MVLEGEAPRRTHAGLHRTLGIRSGGRGGAEPPHQRRHTEQSRAPCHACQSLVGGLRPPTAPRADTLLLDGRATRSTQGIGHSPRLQAMHVICWWGGSAPPRPPERAPEHRAYVVWCWKAKHQEEHMQACTVRWVSARGGVGGRSPPTNDGTRSSPGLHAMHANRWWGGSAPPRPPERAHKHRGHMRNQNIGHTWLAVRRHSTMNNTCEPAEEWTGRTARSRPDRTYGSQTNGRCRPARPIIRSEGPGGG